MHDTPQPCQDQTPEYPSGDGSCSEPCDCGVPCGEYLWNHANGTMLRTWLIDEFLLGPTGLGSPYVDGFYVDDGFVHAFSPISHISCLPLQLGKHLAAGRPPHCIFNARTDNITSFQVQSWEPPGGFCDHSPLGGATEEDYNCVADMGLTQADTTAITENWQLTMQMAAQAIQANNGWAWYQVETRLMSMVIDAGAGTCSATLGRRVSRTAPRSSRTPRDTPTSASSTSGPTAAPTRCQTCCLI